MANWFLTVYISKPFDYLVYLIWSSKDCLKIIVSDQIVKIFVLIKTSEVYINGQYSSCIAIYKNFNSL